MKCIRVLQSDSEKSVRQAKDKLCKASERASETRERTLQRQQQDRLHKASMKATETCEQTLHRQQQNRLCKANTRATETCEQTLHRQQQDRLCKANMRATETCEQTLHRQQQDRLDKANMRATETCEQTLHRQQQARLCKANMRATETCEQTLHRQQQDRLHKANMRATETCEQALRRKQRQKESTTNKRNSIVSVEHAILVFHSAIKNGPDFVCVCCHRMMYRKSVVPCNLAKYSKCSKDLLQNVFSADVCYISNDGNEWVCMTCDRALKRGVMPLQAKANGLKLCKVPPELSDLNALELRLICRRVPFMKMVALPSGKQRSIHGPAVNVPSKVDTICNVLPRLPSQSELVPLKLKRKIEYRGHYLYDFITPQKALRFLKAKNPLYADIAINEEWLEVAIASDSELCECLLEQQDESDMQTCESDDMQSVATSSQNIVTASCSDLPMIECYDNNNDALTTAIHKLETLASQNGFTIHDVPCDGNCMFSAIVYQLNSTGVCDVDSNGLRQMIADYLEANEGIYCDFVCQPVAPTDSYNADTEPPTQEDEYINSISDPKLQTMLRWEKYLTCLPGVTILLCKQ